MFSNQTRLKIHQSYFKMLPSLQIQPEEIMCTFVMIIFSVRVIGIFFFTKIVKN